MKTNNKNLAILLAVLVLIFLQPQFILKAQDFDTKALSKSIVRVKVTGGVHTTGKDRGKPRGTGYATGFVWQNNNHVITSLHAMRRGNDINISVQWTSAPTRAEQEFFPAEIIGINEKADLVLLEVQPGRLTLPNWQALSNRASRSAGDEVMALGYWLSNEAWRRMTLKITETQNNQLKDLPKKATEELDKIGIPDLYLEIIHFENNSLLPGFSGSPLVDEEGHLVAIGDGGIDNGGKNVSWGIPSKYLDDIETATINQLPENLDSSPVHYSAEEPPVESEFENQLNQNNTYESANAYIEDRLEEISYGQFEFYYTKTRTLGEMMETADNPEYLGSMMEDIAALNLNYEDFAYDIYQDINYGIIISVPFGATLEPVQGDDGTPMLKVNFGDEGLNQTYPFFYIYDDGVSEYEKNMLSSDPASFIQTLTDELEKSMGKMMIDIDETSVTTMPTGGTANIGYYLTNDGGANITGYNFLKVALNHDVYLMGLCLLSDYTTQQFTYLEQCVNQNINCQVIDANNQCNDLCTLIRNWMYMITSLHLTSFSNFDASIARLIPGSDFITAVNPTSVNTEVIGMPAAQIQSVWVDHNVYNSYGQLGMNIHVKFTAQNLLNTNCTVAAYFYTSDGTPLLDYNNLYYSADGQVGIFGNFIPAYASAEYNDFVQFFPYDELHMDAGQFMFQVFLMENSTLQTLSSSDKVYFNYEKPY